MSINHFLQDIDFTSVSSEPSPRRYRHLLLSSSIIESARQSKWENVSPAVCGTNPLAHQASSSPSSYRGVHLSLFRITARTELLRWINSVTQAGISKIEECGTGAIYCQVSN